MTSVRVRYPETDRMGVVYHANYLVWFELGRTELMRRIGTSYRDLEERERLYFPVTEARIRYIAPARYDESLEVETRLASVGGARVRFEYVVRRRSDRQLLSTGFTEHASVGEDGRPRRLPAELRDRLVVHAEPQGSND